MKKCTEEHLKLLHVIETEFKLLHALFCIWMDVSDNLVYSFSFLHYFIFQLTVLL